MKTNKDVNDEKKQALNASQVHKNLTEYLNSFANTDIQTLEAIYNCTDEDCIELYTHARYGADNIKTKDPQATAPGNGRIEIKFLNRNTFTHEDKLGMYGGINSLRDSQASSVTTDFHILTIGAKELKQFKHDIKIEAANNIIEIYHQEIDLLANEISKRNLDETKKQQITDILNEYSQYYRNSNTPVEDLVTKALETLSKLEEKYLEQIVAEKSEEIRILTKVFDQNKDRWRLDEDDRAEIEAQIDYYDKDYQNSQVPHNEVIESADESLNNIKIILQKKGVSLKELEELKEIQQFIDASGDIDDIIDQSISSRKQHASNSDTNARLEESTLPNASSRSNEENKDESLDDLNSKIETLLQPAKSDTAISMEDSFRQAQQKGNRDSFTRLNRGILPPEAVTHEAFQTPAPKQAVDYSKQKPAAVAATTIPIWQKAQPKNSQNTFESLVKELRNEHKSNRNFIRKLIANFKGETNYSFTNPVTKDKLRVKFDKNDNIIKTSFNNEVFEINAPKMKDRLNLNNSIETLTQIKNNLVGPKKTPVNSKIAARAMDISNQFKEVVPKNPVKLVKSAFQKFGTAKQTNKGAPKLKKAQSAAKKVFKKITKGYD